MSILKIIITTSIEFQSCVGS